MVELSRVAWWAGLISVRLHKGRMKAQPAEPLRLLNLEHLSPDVSSFYSSLGISRKCFPCFPFDGQPGRCERRISNNRDPNQREYRWQVEYNQKTVSHRIAI